MDYFTSYNVYNIKAGLIRDNFRWGDCNGEYLCVPKELDPNNTKISGREMLWNIYGSGR